MARNTIAVTTQLTTPTVQRRREIAYARITADAIRAEYFVWAASPAKTAAAIALGMEFRSMPRIASAIATSERPTAGMSSIRLTAGSTAGDSAIIHTSGAAIGAANRSSSDADPQTSAKTSGSIQSFSAAGLSAPAMRTPVASQYGSTGGHSSQRAGSGYCRQNTSKPYGSDGCCATCSAYSMKNASSI